MNGITNITINHEKIREWAEKRGGVPGIINHPQALADTPGLRIDFPGGQDDAFIDKKTEKRISWKRFFKLFDALDLAFEYEDIKSKDPSSLYRFIKREP